MIATKNLVLLTIILIVERHLVESQISQHIGGNRISSSSASFWPTRRLNSQSNGVMGNSNNDQSNIQKPNEQLMIKQNDQEIPHITDSPESTLNGDAPPQSSGFWPDSKFVFKRRKNDPTNGPNVDDPTPTTQLSITNNNWQNWNEQSSDDTANQAIFIHYSGADKHKFSGKQTDQVGPNNNPDIGGPVATLTSTAANVWPEQTTGFGILPSNPLSPNDFGISEQEIAEIQQKLSNGWLGVRGIDPVILRLLQVSPEDFEKEFGRNGNLPLPRDND